MITSFRSDVGGGENKSRNEITKGIVSIHLADYSNKCSKHNNNGLVESFESIANDERTSDNKGVSITDAPGVASELENDNIDDNIITGDDDDGDNDDNNDAEDMSGDGNDDDSSQEDSVSTNDNTTFTTNSTDATPLLMWSVAMSGDDGNKNPDNYNKFWSDYDLDDECVFDNNDADIGEGYVCMTLTNFWLPPEEQYNTDDILIRPSVFDVGDKPSIHPIFFNGTINDSRGRPYINNDPISDTQVLHHALLRSSMRIKGVT